MSVSCVSILFAGKISEARELPGAALLCFSFTPKNVNEHQASKVSYLWIAYILFDLTAP